MLKNRFKKKSQEPTKGYEGKEHVKYREPGMTRHEIKFPQDEPHMKGKVSKEESHEMEDNFHMKTNISKPGHLPKKIKRAHMAIEDFESYDPSMRYGNLVSKDGKGVSVGSSGKEQLGPKMHQMDDESKESERKDEATTKDIRKKER